MNQALFWDFDGTLVYSDSLWSRALLRALKRVMPDCALTLEQVRPHLHTGFSWQCPERAYPAHTGELWWESLYLELERACRALGADEPEARRAARILREEICNPENYRLYEDARPMLELACARGWKNYLLSNNYPELPEIVASLGLADCLEGCAVSALVGYEKPRPELFAFAKALAGEPERAWMIGDNPTADVGGGRAAGLGTVLVHRTADCGASHVFETLTELAAIL